MSPIKHVRVGLTLTQKKKLLEDSNLVVMLLKLQRTMELACQPSIRFWVKKKSFSVKHLEKVSLALSVQAASQSNRILQKMNVKLSSQENDVSSNTENSHLPFIIYDKLVRLGKT